MGERPSRCGGGTRTLVCQVSQLTRWRSPTDRIRRTRLFGRSARQEHGVAVASVTAPRQRFT